MKSDVAVVSVKDLHTRLGIAGSLDYPMASVNKPLKEWKMEIDDAPIFRYIYRNFRPRRHLEFGTWQGTGSLYCLEECDATVWTINLLQGEGRTDGTWVYCSALSVPSGRFALSRLFSRAKKKSSRVPFWAKREELSRGLFSYQTDSLGFIGKHYLEAGFGHRVCQIYCDSRQWDVSNYPPAFFDTALIDGGHSQDAVTSDTHKACQLVRAGGLIMWHDFCPQMEVYDHCPSTRGVMSAIKTDWDWLCTQMTDLFWINPSWILLGVKR